MTWDLLIRLQTCEEKEFKDKDLEIVSCLSRIIGKKWLIGASGRERF